MSRVYGVGVTKAYLGIKLVRTVRTVLGYRYALKKAVRGGLWGKSTAGTLKYRYVWGFPFQDTEMMRQNVEIRWPSKDEEPYV